MELVKILTEDLKTRRESSKFVLRLLSKTVGQSGSTNKFCRICHDLSQKYKKLNEGQSIMGCDHTVWKNLHTDVLVQKYQTKKLFIVTAKRISNLITNKTLTFHRSRPLERPRRKWENNIKIDHQKVE